MSDRKKLKVGLALGSGAARGLAHIGIIKALKEKNISVDMMAGSSMGALVGACYAREERIADIEEIVLKMNWKRLARLADPNLALLFKGIIHGNKVKDLLMTLLGDVEFKDLRIPLAVVATDVYTGDEVVIKEGSVAEAVRASISMPAIFMPVKFDNRFLIDGGIINPIPVSVVKDMGATFIIASNTIHEPQRRKIFSSIKRQKPFPFPSISGLRTKNAALMSLNNKINELVQENKDKFEHFKKISSVFKTKVYKRTQKIDPGTPNLFDTIIRAIYAMEYEMSKLKIKEADVIISPDIRDIGALEFYRGKEAILEGYKAAMNIISKRCKFLEHDA